MPFDFSFFQLLKSHHKLTAYIFFAGKFKFSVHQFHIPVYDVQAQACALNGRYVLGPEEPFCQVLLVLFGIPNP
jgi:hypothetical protein